MARAASQPPFAAEIDLVFKALADETITAEGAARHVAKQIAEMKIPREREAQARTLLATFAKTIATLRANDDHVGLRQAASQLFRRAQELARPIPIPRPADIVRAAFDGLQAHGWASATIDLLTAELQAGEKIVSYDPDSITTDQRKIVRQALIDKYLPRAMTADHVANWLKMHTRPDYAKHREPSLGQQLRHGSGY